MLDRKNRQTPSAGRRELWQLLVLLLLVIVLPTVCLLWFMTAAVANERMAVRQKLTDLYRAQLEEANIRLAAFSGSLASELDRGGVGPVAYFEEIVSSDIADSVIVFAPQVGGGSSCLYPCVTAFDLAADSFEGPVAALYEQLSELRRLHRTDRPRANTLAKSLSDALRSYGDSGVTSAQRLFLMQEILALDPSQHFPTRHAEQRGPARGGREPLSGGWIAGSRS